MSDELLQLLARARDLLVAQEDGGELSALARQHLDVSIAALQPGQKLHLLAPPPLRQLQCTQETQTMRKALHTAGVQATPRGTDASSQVVRPASVHTASQAAAMVSVATTQSGGLTTLGARSMQENTHV